MIQRAFLNSLKDDLGKDLLGSAHMSIFTYMMVASSGISGMLTN